MYKLTIILPDKSLGYIFNSLDCAKEVFCLYMACYSYDHIIRRIKDFNLTEEVKFKIMEKYLPIFSAAIFGNFDYFLNIEFQDYFNSKLQIYIEKITFNDNSFNIHKEWGTIFSNVYQEFCNEMKKQQLSSFI